MAGTMHSVLIKEGFLIHVYSLVSVLIFHNIVIQYLYELFSSA